MGRMGKFNFHKNAASKKQGLYSVYNVSVYIFDKNSLNKACLFPKWCAKMPPVSYV